MRTRLFLTGACFSALILLGSLVVSPPSKALTLVEFDIKPDTLNLNRQGLWLTGYIVFVTDGYNASDIDTSKPIWLDSRFEAVWSSIEEDVLMVKFNFDDSLREYLFGKLYHMGNRASIEVEVTGLMKDSSAFLGTDTVVIMNPPFGK